MLIYSLSIKIERGFEDIIEAVIESGKLNILGFNIEFPIKEESISIVNIYNENEEILKNNLNIIEENIKGIAEYTYKTEELKSEEYLTSYMDFLKPFNIGDVTIVPNLKDFYNEECENPLYIAKQYAFGSGTHETTSLALEMIYEYSNNNDIVSKSIADIGCGSGILSLFAYKLGARNITSIDIDNDAVHCTLDNADYNSIKLDNVILGNARDLINMNLKFDLVIANIETDILIDILPDLKELLKPSSTLILSGILLEKESYMINAIRENKLNTFLRKRKNDWVSLMLNL
ncbi:50S ribosomal protein L11 methyltransferase [Brachyspira hyodysenteriae]|uniref:50S ribosomal protein L11 methyltransferase n=1 Tax=Brachyspira hyodysenteriae TaxID=159 RepID=UPI00063D93E6|nr:50S ribosomal protein L11 methyltransferase [Brachyspira hyodysenteriae]KLI23021.1 50S ribosomal protein L11 methyltransferase [Brachyspira hyodysenteriae]MCZ9955615.1 50S ribosomal protein L11 methyltransferase [Brachyspira hyodysenteriae]MCZ9961045.1 50S ribosomal protein L11 methyltransferase [Brachyspira hyodysenteriae]MDA0034347.1 50S ribosomal protein L11 methyltransferase [Brachyspira hyodysenteriae]MDA0048423.1 50S ribosomal protein L11 methyltransferase [Brachyspira hyodysenteriae]